MPGFDNDVVYAKNVDFSGGTPVAGKMLLDGQLLIGRTALNAGGTHIDVGTLTAGNNVTITNGPGTISIAGTDLHVAKWIVNATPNAGGNQTTIQAAINAAVSGEDIFIMPGTYTENLSLKAGVNLTSFPCDGSHFISGETSNVTIIGKASFTTAGTVCLSNIRFQTNGDYAISVTGSAASLLNVFNCDIQCTNFNGINVTSSAARVLFNHCTGNITALTFALFAVTAGFVLFIYCKFSNSISSLAANTNSGANLSAYYTIFGNRYETSSTGNFSFNYTAIELLVVGGIPITTAGTAVNSIYHCELASGDSAVLSLGTGTTTYVIQSIFQRGGASDITGAGAVFFSGITERGNTARVVIASTTPTAMYTEIGRYTAIGQPCFQAYLTASANNVTGDGTNYTILFNGENFDQNSNFNTGTGTFTAPVTGKYHLTAYVLFGALAAANNTITVTITTTSRNYISQTDDTIIATGSNQGGRSHSVIADMSAGDTAIVVANVGGGTKIVNVLTSNASDPRTLFMGQLVA